MWGVYTGKCRPSGVFPVRQQRMEQDYWWLHLQGSKIRVRSWKLAAVVAEQKKNKKESKFND
jgi:hypothetical protein